MICTINYVMYYTVRYTCYIPYIMLYTILTLYILIIYIGPDGGISASKYAYVGGFDGTSNVLAGKFFGLNVSGTHAHAYVMAHIGMVR